MSLRNKNTVLDGWTSLSGGQNSGRDASLIEKNQAHRLTNMVCRGGVGAETRPTFKAHELSFRNRDLSYDENGVFVSINGTPDQSVENFHTGTFQEAAYFVPHGTKPSFVALIGGRYYRISPKRSSGIEVEEIPLPVRNRNTIRKAYMQQADRFMVAQDGESRPIIYDGVTARRALSDEVPVGTFMAYGMGRLCVAMRRHEIAFGDLYGSHDGSEGKRNFTDAGDSVLLFTESTFLNEGYNASIGFNLGEITGLCFAPQQDSAVGDGELIAFSENGASSFFLSQPREIWKDSAFQRVTLINTGGRSHGMTVSVNGDLWFRSDDGWRSYRQARAEIQGWAHLPMSTEVSDFVSSDTPDLLQHGSAILFNNRLISTCTPRTNQGRVYHKGLLSLDFDVLSTFGQAERPAWDGYWEKLKFLKLVVGKFHGRSRAFAFAIDADGNNQIYELNANPGGDDFDGAVDWDVQMRSFDFNSPFNEHSILSADVWVQDVDSTTTITAQYRSDQEPDWQPWVTLPAINKVGTCQQITCGGVPTVRPGYYPRRTLPKPPSVTTGQTGREARRFFQCQARLSGSGHVILNQFRLVALDLTEDEKARDL